MISSLMTQIDNNEIVLPAIQRNFVWNEERITMMFDSIMRGYPLGIILLWETYLTEVSPFLNIMNQSYYHKTFITCGFKSHFGLL